MVCVLARARQILSHHGLGRERRKPSEQNHLLFARLAQLGAHRHISRVIVRLSKVNQEDASIASLATSHDVFFPLIVGFARFYLRSMVILPILTLVKLISP